MSKLMLLLPFLFSGCYFTFNAAMCDQIARDPNAVMPRECRNYVEAEADKASKNVNKILDAHDAIEFTKEVE